MKKLLILLILGSFANAQEVWSLEKATRYAIENNITVKKSKLDRLKFEIEYKQAKNNRLPSLNGSLGQSFSSGKAIDPITDIYSTQSSNSTSLGLNSSITIFNGNRVNNQIKQQELALKQNDLYTEAAVNNIILSVTESYVQVLYAKENIKTAELTKDYYNKAYSQAKYKYNAGAISRSDLIDIEAQKASTDYNITSAKTQYEQRLLELKQLLELNVDKDIVLEDITSLYTDNYNPSSPQQIYEIATETLPELKVFDLDKEIGEKNIAIAKAGYLPSVSASASLNTGRSSSSNASLKDQFDRNLKKSLSLSMNIPIFNKFENKNNVELQKLSLEQIDLNKQQSAKDLYKKIETAWLNASTNKKELEAAKISKDLAYESFTLASKKQTFGASTKTDLLMIETNFNKAQAQYLQTKYMGVLYNILLDSYQGKLTNYYTK